MGIELENRKRKEQRTENNEAKSTVSRTRQMLKTTKIK